MKKAILFILIALLLIASIVAISMNRTTKPVSGNTEQARPEYNGINSTFVFGDLPPYPSKFVLIKRNFYDGQIKNLTEISENYWKQPEFYPTWERNGISWFTNHNYNRWGVHGYGFFPGELSYSITNMSKGDVLSTYSFLHTSWGIESWQGIKLKPIYNESLFDAEIIPDTLLLYPTFPKFYYNWSYLIKYNIIAKQKVPAGHYDFFVAVVSPSENINERWSWEVLDLDTKQQYHFEIEQCQKQLSNACLNLIEMRKNKYIGGGLYAPSSLFDIVVDVS